MRWLLYSSYMDKHPLEVHVDSALGHQNGPEEAAWAPAEPGDPPPAQIQRQLEIITSTLAVYH
jgi:hypothetical protein